MSLKIISTAVVAWNTLDKSLKEIPAGLFVTSISLINNSKNLTVKQLIDIHLMYINWVIDELTHSSHITKVKNSSEFSCSTRSDF